MSNAKEVTAFQAGLSGDELVRLALQTIDTNGGVAEMADIYKAVQSALQRKNLSLSAQGKASLRFYVNKVAVKAGFVLPFDRNNPGWRITSSGRAILAENPPEQVTLFSVDTGSEEQVDSNVARGTAFEFYVLDLLKIMHPYYSWYHQGTHKHHERGLDFIGDRISDNNAEPRTIGVQVKFHGDKFAPTQIEWLKFLSGCFARRVDKAIFITTGQLTSEQRREAREAQVIVIEGRKEISRIAQLHKVEPFKLFSSSPH
jgi:hypothetical protein